MNVKKKVGMALATTALGTMLVAGSVFALFTDETTNTNNTFTAGTVAIEDVTGGPVFHHTLYYNNLAPGDRESATLRVENRGTLDAWVKVDDFAGTGALFAGVNPLEINITGDAVMIPANGAADFAVEYYFPLEAGNEYQGATGTVDVEIIAVQARNNTNPGGTGPISWN